MLLLLNLAHRHLADCHNYMWVRHTYFVSYMFCVCFSFSSLSCALGDHALLYSHLHSGGGKFFTYTHGFYIFTPQVFSLRLPSISSHTHTLYIFISHRDYKFLLVMHAAEEYLEHILNFICIFCFGVLYFEYLVLYFSLVRATLYFLHLRMHCDGGGVCREGAGVPDVDESQLGLIGTFVPVLFYRLYLSNYEY